MQESFFIVGTQSLSDSFENLVVGAPCTGEDEQGCSAIIRYQLVDPFAVPPEPQG
jgi:hypothetical protein